jgi:AraC-like DNA-binding protein
MRFRENAFPGRSLVTGAGRIRDKGNVCLDRDFRAYALVYLTAGTGFYADEHHGRRSVSAGDVLVLFPGMRHSYGPETPGDWSECWVGFSGPLFAQLETEGLLDRNRPVLTPGVDTGLIAQFEALTAAADRIAGDSDPVLVARVHLLCAEVVDHAARHVGAGSLVQQAQAALIADLRSPLDLPSLAARLGVSYDGLRRAFHVETGTTPGHWRTLRRIEKAKSLLVAGATLDAIADELGYCDRFFLARQFRTVVGQPPGAWRKDFLGTSRR